MAEKTSKTAKKADGEAEVRAKIAALRPPYNAMGERIHALILRSAPALLPRVWYGMPGYAKGSGPVLCFFRLDDRYMTFGLTEKAHLSREADASDQLMASAWFFETLDAATEARIAEIVQRAAR